MNILILRVSALGDVIHTIPALALLKYHFPQAKIHWIVQKKAAPLVRINPHVDYVWELPDDYLKPRHWRRTASIITQLKKINFDAIIDFQGLIKTSILALPLRGKRFGFSWRHARESITALFNHQTITPEYVNILQKNIALVSMVCSDLKPSIDHSPVFSKLMSGFTFSIPTSESGTVEHFLQTLPAAPLVLSPNTTWASKHWPINAWKEFLTLAAQLVVPHCPIVLLGEKFGPQGAQLAEFVRQQALPIVIAPAWTLQQVVFLLGNAQLLIAPDTGVLHLADCLGSRTIGLFGPTKALRHGPFIHDDNRRSTIQVQCPHFYKKTHTNNKFGSAKTDCMNTLEANGLMNAVLGVLHDRHKTSI